MAFLFTTFLRKKNPANAGLFYIKALNRTTYTLLY